MTLNRDDQSDSDPATDADPLDAPVSRGWFLGMVSTLPRKATLASAALFGGFAARGTEPAIAHPGQGQFYCCSLARPDQWCSQVVGGDFWCDHGGFKRVWYCCDPSFGVVGCGECQSSSGTCTAFPNEYYCSYGWWTGPSCS